MRVFRAIKYVFLIVVALALVVLAFANRDPVTVTLLPQELAIWSGVEQAIDLPLFVVILGGVVTGVLWGFVWEWLREHTIRAENSRNAREVRRLEREIKRLKTEKHEGKDEVLALLDEAS